jgi:hypothetical protein
MIAVLSEDGGLRKSPWVVVKSKCSIFSLECCGHLTQQYLGTLTNQGHRAF